MSDKRDDETKLDEIEQIKRRLEDIIRGISRPMTSDKRRKPAGLYEWDIEPMAYIKIASMEDITQ